ncbi:MAG: hypothetical protein ACOC2H_03605 [Spirochaetota bacterium]
MNFLSHHFLQRKPGNDYYSIGVTFPDILSLHDTGTVINRNRFTYSVSRQSLKPAHASFLKGMAEHMHSDKVFHGSKFFRDNLASMQRRAVKDGVGPVPEILRHILLEILMDRFLILNHEGIAEDFYELYTRFPVRTVFPLLHSFCTFDESRLLNFIDSFVRRRFFLRYRDIDGVLEGIELVNKSLNVGYTFEYPRFSRYVVSLYESSEEEIRRFFLMLQRKH